MVMNSSIRPHTATIAQRRTKAEAAIAMGRVATWVAGLAMMVVSSSAAAETLISDKDHQDQQRHRGLNIRELAGIDEETLIQQVRRDTMMKEDAPVGLQIVEDDQSFEIDGQTIPLRDGDLIKVKIFANDVEDKLRQHSMFEVKPELIQKYFSEGNNQRSLDRIFISKLHGKFLNAVKVKGDGNLVEVMPVANGLYSEVQFENVDNEKLAGLSHDLVFPDFPDDSFQAFHGVPHRVRRDLARSLRGQIGSLADSLGEIVPESRSLASECTEYHVIRLGLRFDSRYCGMFETREEAEAHLYDVVGIASSWYEKPGICKRIEICSLQGYCHKEEDGPDPFRRMMNRSKGFCGKPDHFLERFTKYIFPMKRYPAQLPTGCDVIHLITGNDDQGGRPYNVGAVGCAYIAAACTPFATGIDNFEFTKSTVSRAALLAHEIGHNLGAQHVPDSSFTVMRPEVCECDGFTDGTREVINAFSEWANTYRQCFNRTEAVPKFHATATAAAPGLTGGATKRASDSGDARIRKDIRSEPCNNGATPSGKQCGQRGIKKRKTNKKLDAAKCARLRMLRHCNRRSFCRWNAEEKKCKLKGEV